MDSTENVVIDNQSIELKDLTDEGRLYVQRVMELRNNLGQLDLQRQEIQVLIQAYANSIKNSMEVVQPEEVAEQVN
jgi:hypothetical protein